MKTNLEWFTVQFTLTGLSQLDEPTAVGDLLEELSARSHLRNSKVEWQGETKHVFIQVETEAMDADQAAQMVGEELYEVCSVVLKVVNGVRLTPTQ